MAMQCAPVFPKRQRAGRCSSQTASVASHPSAPGKRLQAHLAEAQTGAPGVTGHDDTMASVASVDL